MKTFSLMMAVQSPIKSRFDLGKINVSEGGMKLGPGTAMRYIRRHAAGDWGEFNESKKLENEYNLKHGQPIMSAYVLPDQIICVITLGDRSSTLLFIHGEEMSD